MARHTLAAGPRPERARRVRDRRRTSHGPDRRPPPTLGHHGGVATITPTKSPWTRRQRIVFGAVLAGGLGLILAGFASAKTGDEGNKPSDPAIERLIPQPGDSLQVNQDTVGVDLQTGFRGELLIDGELIPTVDLNQSSATTPFEEILQAVYDAGQGTVLFTPRQGAVIEAFSPGRHNIIVRYWKTTETKEQARTFTWGFDVKT